MRVLVAGVLAAVAAGAFAGCGEDEAAAPPSACPTYPVVSGPDGVKDFVVTLDISLMADAEARRGLVRGVGEELCLSLTEEKRVSVDTILVDAGIRLDEQGQRKVVEALRAVDGVRLVEPDAVVTVDPAPDQ